MASYVLHNYFRSSTSFRVRIALNLKNLSFDYKAVHLLKDGGQQNAASYRSINPSGGVPALQNGDFILAESMAILEYLDVKHPEPKLIPAEIESASIVRQMCETMNCNHSYTNLRTLQFLTNTIGISEDQKKQWCQHWLHSTLDTLEKLAQKYSGDYFYKDSLTAADVFLIPYLTTSRRFEVNTTQYTKLTQIENKCMQLEAFQKATPDKQPDYNP